MESSIEVSQSPHVGRIQAGKGVYFDYDGSAGPFLPHSLDDERSELAMLPPYLTLRMKVSAELSE